ncbi:uncharacterized protein MAM_08030 [Metarhizium album ARSEF 1941]|uniref:Methyltransferase FkbM domain-containing protein n=1 Tax=Metarhizium album (strain ARSEF 1941) TaxID=1081103 RepID=A0A0B2WM57_METAS|nr:uncharacterized protein MAM_08030 [Metarhizium album ARSEF 1941]KHN94100.1 hypothetical protein MAM_08030 [Metarhizium album ARSEF 1941]
MGIGRSYQHILMIAAVWAVLFFIAYLGLVLNQDDVNFIKMPFTRSTVRPRSAVRPRYVFVDLGANRADSLDIFLQRREAKFQYEFPRPEWARHDEADIYLFEGNPGFNEALVEAKQRCLLEGINVNIFPSTIVDVRDGTRTFFLDTVNHDHDYWGSSTYAHHQDALKSGSNGTELTAVDISRWLLMNTLPHDFVVVKMDIEGSEYDVIPHMADMGASSVIDYLFVEWHYTLPEQDAIQRAQVAADTLVANGVNMPHYDSPS